MSEVKKTFSAKTLNSVIALGKSPKNNDFRLLVIFDLKILKMFFLKILCRHWLTFLFPNLALNSAFALGLIPDIPILFLFLEKSC